MTTKEKAAEALAKAARDFEECPATEALAIRYADLDKALTDYEEAANATPANPEESDLLSALKVVLDNVDYTEGMCGHTEMVSAVLPRHVIKIARDAISKYKHVKRSKP